MPMEKKAIRKELSEMTRSMLASHIETMGIRTGIRLGVGLTLWAEHMAHGHGAKRLTETYEQFQGLINCDNVFGKQLNSDMVLDALEDDYGIDVMSLKLPEKIELKGKHQ